MREFSFVIAAGGSGSRMGNVRKQFMTLGGKALWRWSADVAAKTDGVREIVLIVPAGFDGEISAPYPVKVTHGGSERALSVLNGLREAACDYVMVHDAARPFGSKELFRRLMDSTDDDAGVVPVLPVSDALKRIDGTEIECVDREGLYITQTPQSFPREKLIEAVKACPLAKDEAEAWQNVGHELRYVEGERLNFKVTQKEDMMIARALTEGTMRTGLGYDVHRLVPERRLILGGVEIASPLGLLGHSDADVLAHAVMDAVLGGAGLPDIGNLFPASSEEFRGADSMKLLDEVMRRVEAEGWEVVFVDAVVEAQVPRLNKYREAIIANLSEHFPCNLKFKSAEGLDDAGAGLSMTCFATATMRRMI
ncbi:MAG: 2-C-methyl-D-erythritol 2,4-cyclodiphosphate synthase [Synergistaceae bacterium]|nr:2-C-methyl-D-erythritol 2,4-cyclodiphosphate synthase [Synergistaceae bacterium]